MYIYIYVYSTRIFFWFMSFCHILTVRECIPGSTPNLRVSLQCQLVRERYDEDSMMDRWPTPSTNNMEVTNNRSWVDFELRLDSNFFKKNKHLSQLVPPITVTGVLPRKKMCPSFLRTLTRHHWLTTHVFYMFLVFRTVDLVVTNQPYQQPPLYPSDVQVVRRSNPIPRSCSAVWVRTPQDGKLDHRDVVRWTLAASEIRQFYQLIGLWRIFFHFS